MASLGKKGLTTNSHAKRKLTPSTGNPSAELYDITGMRYLFYGKTWSSNISALLKFLVRWPFLKHPKLKAK